MSGEDCPHPDSEIVIHHRDAVRDTIQSLQTPAYCEACDTELQLTYSLDECVNARKGER